MVYATLIHREPVNFASDRLSANHAQQSSFPVATRGENQKQSFTQSLFEQSVQVFNTSWSWTVKRYVPLAFRVTALLARLVGVIPSRDTSGTSALRTPCSLGRLPLAVSNRVLLASTLQVKSTSGPVRG